MNQPARKSQPPGAPSHADAAWEFLQVELGLGVATICERCECWDVLCVCPADSCTCQMQLADRGHKKPLEIKIEALKVGTQVWMRATGFTGTVEAIRRDEKMPTELDLRSKPDRVTGATWTITCLVSDVERFPWT